MQNLLASKQKRRLLRLLALAVFLMSVLLISCSVSVQWPGGKEPVKKLGHKSVSNAFLTHFSGGFGINTPDKVQNASLAGIQVAFNYGPPPSPDDPTGEAMLASHMKVVDAMPWTYLHQYACSYLKTTQASTVPASYCSDNYPTMTDEHALLSAIATHLQQVKTNQLIVGYWVLDDWIPQAGDAKPLLNAIHSLIQQYTPGRPTICGFSATIGLNQDYDWQDQAADNFSPQGCDMVAPYVYSSALKDHTISPDMLNWSMQGLLSNLFTSLQSRGWDINEEPFIGIGQAFGGSLNDTNRYYIIPDTQTIALQSRSFCAQGATGMVFYTWDSAGFKTDYQTPVNNLAIAKGLQDGIVACRAQWHS